MRSVSLSKDIGFGLFSAVVGLPIVVYTVELGIDCARMYWKFDWDVRPMAYVSVGGIVIYLAYTAFVTAGLMWASRATHSRYLRGCALVTGLMLGVYGLGLLTRVLGVLPAVQ